MTPGSNPGGASKKETRESVSLFLQTPAAGGCVSGIGTMHGDIGVFINVPPVRGALPDTGRTQKKLRTRRCAVCRYANRLALLVPLQQHGHALGASGTAEDEHRTEYLQRQHRLVQQHGREHDGRERLKIPHTATVCTGSCPIAEKYQQQPSPVFTAPSSTIHPRSSGRMLTANPRSRMPMNTAAVRKPKSICSAAFSCPVMCTARLFSVIITA